MNCMDLWSIRVSRIFFLVVDYLHPSGGSETALGNILWKNLSVITKHFSFTVDNIEIKLKQLSSPIRFWIHKILWESKGAACTKLKTRRQKHSLSEVNNHKIKEVIKGLSENVLGSWEAGTGSGSCIWGLCRCIESVGHRRYSHRN